MSSASASATEDVDDDVYSVVSGAAHLGRRCRKKLAAALYSFLQKHCFSTTVSIVYKLTNQVIKWVFSISLKNSQFPQLGHEFKAHCIVLNKAH